jgi:predicted Zn-dependent peptidase
MYRPEPPVVFAGPGGSEIWLYERHNLPLVAMSVVLPYGSAADPADQWGLSYITAEMLTEGAGKLDALGFSEAVHDLGASIESSADRDHSAISLQVLTDKLDKALTLVSDAVARPRLAKKDFDRVHTLWKNGLDARAEDPANVARVVTSLGVYGPTHPYGHPPDGVRASVPKVTLADVTRWHKTMWRPDAARFVVVGDVTRDALAQSIERAFGSWKAPASPRPPIPSPPPPAPAPNGVRTLVVDRPDAPQVVLSIARPGISASDPARPDLELANIALGGSFMSRLNQSLREQHGWTYGARTGFAELRSTGTFNVRAAIRADAISPALGETWKIVTSMADSGVTADEMQRMQAQAQGDVLQSYSTVGHVAASLAGNAGLGLPPDDDARTIEAQLAATKEKVDAVSKQYLQLEGATVVLVGPRDVAEKAFADNQLPPPELRDADGRAPGEAPEKKQPTPKQPTPKQPTPK